MRITVLASGSRGNATLVEAGGVRILIDAGLPPRTIRKRIKRALGAAPERLDAVVVTHAHGDHAAHAGAAGEVFSAPVYVTEATHRTLRFRHRPKLRIYGARAAFAVGPLVVHPLPVPHDAPQVALVLEHAGSRAALVTDVGHVRADLVDHIRDCDTVLLESNYDPELLARGPYAAALQKRIRSGHGHLSNGEAAALLRHLGPRTRTVVLMHLSEKNNLPALARASASEALAGRDVQLFTAHQTNPLAIESEARGQLSLPIEPPSAA